MERGVITEIPLYVLQMFSSSSPIISRLIGVTSHTTPLSIRRGAGGEAVVFSVRERNTLRERKRRYEAVSISGLWWHRLFLSCMKNIYKTQQGRPLFTMEILARYETITHMNSESYKYETRRGLSCIMKGMFLYQERHVLGCWRAFPWALKGMDRMGEGRK